MATTQDYLDAISKAKASGTPIKNFDPSSFPPGIDTRQVMGALLDGLPEAHANAINARVLSRQPISKIDFARIPGAAQPMAAPPGQGGIYQDHPILRAASNYAIRPALEIGGQAGGAALAAPVAAAAAAIPAVGPAAAFATEKAAAGVGGTAGDMLADKIDKFMGLYHPEEMSPEATRKMRLTQLASNTIGSAAGSAVGSVAKEFAAPYKGEIDQAVKSSADKLGVSVPAGGLLKSETPGRMEALFSKLPFASDVMRKYYQASRDKMVAIANDLFSKGGPPNPQTMDRLGAQVAQDLGEKVNDMAKSGITPQLDPGDVGKSMRLDVLGGLRKMSEAAGSAFESIKKSDAGQMIATPTAEAQMQKVSQEGIQHPAIKAAMQALGGAAEQGVPAEMSPAITAALNNPATSPAAKEALLKQLGPIPTGGATISKLIDVRNALSAAADQHIVEGGSGISDDRVGGAFNSIIGALDKDIEAGSPGIASAYKSARQGWGVYAQTRDNSAVRRVLRAEQPEAIVDELIKPDRTTNLGRVIGLLSPETRDQVKSTFINKAIDSAYDADGKFVPQKLNNFLSRMGDETVTLAAGPEGLDNLKKLANLSDGSFSDPAFRQFVTMLGKKDGANLSGMLLQPNNAQNINRTRALIGEKSFGDAHDAALFDLITNNQGNIDFGGLGKRMNETGNDTLHALFGPEVTETLEHLSNVGRGLGRAEKVFANPSGTAQVFGLMAIMFRALNNPLNALKFVGSLTGIAKAYTSPFVTQWLTEGVAPNMAGDIASGAVKYPVSVIGNSLANPYKNRGKK